MENKKISAEGVALGFLGLAGQRTPEENKNHLVHLLNEFGRAGYLQGLTTATHIYKDKHPGGCRTLSEGSDCKCFLCLTDVARSLAG